ncbi:MAG: pyridoxal phosphate-dependent aminotransferase [Acidobacteria bacterium]|nr:MAG: pyridoxal phosphate-dependent aminotransferase [Acidobacteriota bacterium]
MSEAARLKAEGRDLVDFGAGEPDFATPENITAAGIAALAAHNTKYTPTAGTAALRAAIAAAHRRDFGSDYAADDVLVTSGGKHGLFNAISSLVDDGDEVILPAPYWVSFRDQIRYVGATPVLVEAGEAAGFSLSLAAIERALTPRTRAILLNSPNNPSGAVLPPELFRAVLALCREHRLWLLSDECYARLVYDARPYSVGAEPGARERAIICGSLSKTYAMTGWRIGYVLAPPAARAAMLALQSHSTGNATTFAQAGAVEALSGPQDAVVAMLAAYRERRGLIVAGLNALPGVSCQLPAGAFYAWANVSGALTRLGMSTANELAQKLLREAGVVTVPGEVFGGPAHLRFSYAAAPEVIAAGLQRLRTVLH